MGVEKKPLPHMLCTTNLILHNIDNPQIKHDNSLGYPIKDIKPKDKVDIILTNEAVICGLTPEKARNIKEFAA